MSDSRRGGARAAESGDAEVSRLRVAPRSTPNSTELGELSHALSHDLRAPLRAIEGFSAALDEDYAERLDAEGQQLLSRVRAAAARMGTLIDGLVELARVGKRPLVREEFDLALMAQSIVAALRARDPAHAVRLKCASRLMVFADRALVRLLLEQLLDNAWKFTTRTHDAAIELGVASSTPTVLFYVRDNGVGFDPAYAAGLFEPFQRVHAAPDFPGIGIGLALVQRVVRQHGGRVWIEAAPGAGASVFFSLDAGAVEPEAGGASDGA